MKKNMKWKGRGQHVDEIDEGSVGTAGDTAGEELASLDVSGDELDFDAYGGGNAGHESFGMLWHLYVFGAVF